MTEHVKGVAPSEVQYDGSGLRVAIVHARWNKVIIDALVKGATSKLLERGVQQSNIIVQSVPGSFELPLACSKCVSIYYLFEFALTDSQSIGSRTRPSRRKCH